MREESCDSIIAGFFVLLKMGCSMKKILFVCHGNICRSPMAEFVMRDLLRREGMEARVQVASAGTSSEELGNPIYPPAQRILRANNIDPSGKVARQLTRSDYDAYDYLLAMEQVNLRKMNRLFSGDPEGKCFRLLDLTARPRDIADPWYSGDFQATWLAVKEGCEALLQRLFLEV